MRKVLFGKVSLFLQNIKNRRKLSNVKTTTDASFKRFLKLASVDYLIHKTIRGFV